MYFLFTLGGSSRLLRMGIVAVGGGGFGTAVDEEVGEDSRTLKEARRSRAGSSRFGVASAM